MFWRFLFFSSCVLFDFFLSCFLLSSLYFIKYNLSSIISKYFYIFLVFSEYIVTKFYFICTKWTFPKKCPFCRFIILIIFFTFLSKQHDCTCLERTYSFTHCKTFYITDIYLTSIFSARFFSSCVIDAWYHTSQPFCGNLWNAASIRVKILLQSVFSRWVSARIKCRCP